MLVKCYQCTKTFDYKLKDKLDNSRRDRKYFCKECEKTLPKKGE